MGTFIGHIVPGSFFILFGAWWIFRAMRAYLKSFSKRGTDFQCQVTYPPKLRCNIDLEAILIVIAAAIGISIELFFANTFQGRPILVSNIQHTTIYFFFGLFGVVGILTPTLKQLLPNMDNMLYVTLTMAFATEAILFKFHLMDRDGLDRTMHVLLLFAMIGCVIMTVLEAVFRNQVLMGLGRGFFTLLQGSWFWQVAFVIFDPIPGHAEWDHSDHDQIMLITCFYAWHMGVIFLFVLACGIGWAYVLRKKGELGNTTLEPISNGYTHLLNQADIETGVDDQV